MAGISDETYEQLRHILEKQNSKAYSLEEVKQIGDGLLDFFTFLIHIDEKINGRS
jgi:hypothetical protein